MTVEKILVGEKNRSPKNGFLLTDFFAKQTKFWDQFRLLGKLPTYDSHKLTLALNSHFGQNDGLG